MSEDLTKNTSGQQLARLLAIGADDTASKGDAPNLHSGVASGASARADNEPGPFEISQVVDGFRILEEIGRGGMCVVYKAYEESLKRTVALKALRPSLARDFKVAQRFASEAVMAGNLQHPGIVPVFTSGRGPDNQPYFTMELVNGISARQAVSQDGPMAPARAVNIALEACLALQHAHDNNIVHRDVTPRNIMLAEPDGRVRLTDFGIARDITGQLAEITELPTSMGTPAYMSPEQNLGKPLDRRTDIYSLGITLYYMLTGKPAFEATNRADLALAHQMRPLIPPSVSNPAVGKQLDAIIQKMLAADRDKRYPDCRAVAADLRASLTGTPNVSAPPAAQSRRWQGPAGIVVAAILLGAIGGWFIYSSGNGPPARVADGGSGLFQAGLTDDDDGDQKDENPASLTATSNKNRADSKAAPPPAALPAEVVVHWVYQPDPDKSFEDGGAIRGSSVMDPAGLHSGIYVFRPGAGLAPAAGPMQEKIDFRISSTQTKLHIVRDAPGDYAGCIAAAGADQYWAATAPTTGYNTFYEYEMNVNMVLLFKCANGGRAKMYIGPAPPAKPKNTSDNQRDLNSPVGGVE